MRDGSYTNPVYPGYFADPFVWRYKGVWYAVGTGLLEAHGQAGRAGEMLTKAGNPGVFLLLRSEDFIDWSPVGSAMELLHREYGDAYWAPEVAFTGGVFYLYYSVGFGDKLHHIRVAKSEHPEGPYLDCGVRLTDPSRCSFAIDASPFCDDDGQWYLFYARDFLDEREGAKQGTALVVDRLVGMVELAGEENVVARARHPWQQFAANRIMYGAHYDWHTLEGPCVLKRNRLYYCLFSAGRWENESYGVDWVTADRVTGPYSDQTTSDGARLLRTVPGSVLGPGHNCVAAGPNGDDYLVYHAWDPAMTGRRMFIDPLHWGTDGPQSPGPTFTPQPLS